jgi:hypothetical protein
LWWAIEIRSLELRDEFLRLDIEDIHRAVGIVGCCGSVPTVLSDRTLPNVRIELVLDAWLAVRSHNMEFPSEILIISFADVGNGDVPGVCDGNVFCTIYSEGVLKLPVPID